MFLSNISASFVHLKGFGYPLCHLYIPKDQTGDNFKTGSELFIRYIKCTIISHPVLDTG